jgi:hypothetical protein
MSKENEERLVHKPVTISEVDISAVNEFILLVARDYPKVAADVLENMDMSNGCFIEAIRFISPEAKAAINRLPE